MSQIFSGIVSGLGYLGRSTGATALAEVLTTPVESSVMLLKLEAFDQIIRTWIAEYLQSMIATANQQSVIDPSGFIDIFVESLKTTAKLGIILSPEIVEELFLELIQEGLSNAIQFSISGALQNIYSYYRGSVPIQIQETSSVFKDVNDIDTLSAIYLLATSGESTTTLSYRLKQAFDQYLDTEFRLIREQVVANIRILNDLANWFNNVLRSEIERIQARVMRQLEELFDRYVALLYNLVDRAIGRLNEISADADASFTLYSNNIITQQEALDDLTEAEAHLDALDSTFSVAYVYLRDQFLSDVDQFQFIDIKDLLDQKMLQLYNEIAKSVGSVIIDYNFTKAIDILDSIQKIRQQAITTVTSPSLEYSTPAGSITVDSKLTVALDVFDLSVEVKKYLADVVVDNVDQLVDVALEIVKYRGSVVVDNTDQTIDLILEIV